MYYNAHQLQLFFNNLNFVVVLSTKPEIGFGVINLSVNDIEFTESFFVISPVCSRVGSKGTDSILHFDKGEFLNSEYEYEFENRKVDES